MELSTDYLHPRSCSVMSCILQFIYLQKLHSTSFHFDTISGYFFNIYYSIFFFLYDAAA